jgi:hypothetical protein
MTAEQAAALIERLERLPVQVDHLVTGLTPSRLTTPFLPTNGRWRRMSIILPTRI